MVQIENEEIIQYSLPKTGKLSTGESVSGYHLLDEEILKQEGWLPLEDIEPEYDKETHCLVDDGYDIQEDKVIKLYKVEEIPPKTPSLLERVEELERALAELVEKVNNIQ